ncbi:unnamed protein product [Linum trigynum]|uniref:Uncharacterized protein n=1 Tax=Linum trigynum TaxID=586398 RepID=A0AAV2FU97_9ROSI
MKGRDGGQRLVGSASSLLERERQIGTNSAATEIGRDCHASTVGEEVSERSFIVLAKSQKMMGSPAEVYPRKIGRLNP